MSAYNEKVKVAMVDQEKRFKFQNSFRQDQIIFQNHDLHNFENFLKPKITLESQKSNIHEQEKALSNKSFDDLDKIEAYSQKLDSSRPVTAISLPNQCQEKDKSLNARNFIPKLINGGSRLKNPSCPLIIRHSLGSYTENILNCNESDGTNEKTTERLIIHMNSNPKPRKTKIDSLQFSKKTEYTNRRASKFGSAHSLFRLSSIDNSSDISNKETMNIPVSKAEYFPSHATTLFTTKFECIGPVNTGSNTSIKSIEESSRNSFRTKSVSNLKPSELSSHDNSTKQLKVDIKQRDYTTLNHFQNQKITDRNYLKNAHLYSSETSLNVSNIQNYSYNDNMKKSSSNLESCKSSNNNFLSVTEDIIVGNMNSIKNERKMCRLKIEYIIDLTNMRPDDLNRQTLGKLPCLCKNQHSRLYLAIEITDKSYKTLFNSFAEINKFVQKAHKEGKKTLLFAKECTSEHLLCALAQYLMLEYEMNLENSLNIIFQKITNSNKIQINQCYLDYLQNFESYLQHMSISLYGTSGKVLNYPNTIVDGEKFFPNVSNKNTFSNKDEKSSFSENEDDDDDVNSEQEINVRNITKVSTNKFTKLPIAGATDLDDLRKSSNINLKMAWM